MSSRGAKKKSNRILIEIPCMVGCDVFAIITTDVIDGEVQYGIVESTITSYELDKGGLIMHFDCVDDRQVEAFGYSVFLDRSEAEKMLCQLQNEQKNSK